MKKHPFTLITIAAVVAISCNTPKETVTVAPATAPVEEPASPVETFHTGKVTRAFAGEGCALLIELDGQQGTFLIPIGLEEKYTVDGMGLQFKYQPSRASNGGCMKGLPAVLTEVRALPRTPSGVIGTVAPATE